MTESEEITASEPAVEVRVRRLHRRDLNRTWEFLKLVFRDVNRETVEYQRPRSKKRFLDIYEEDEAEQLLFEANNEVVGYAECTFEISMGSDNWLNPRYFDKRDMRPMFVDELAVHPRMQGRGVGGFMIDQLQHLARLRGCTHLVLEVAENNRDALMFYRHRGFQKMDAAIFMAQKIDSAPDLLPPRKLNGRVVPSAASNGAANGLDKGKSSPPKKRKRKPREVELIAIPKEIAARGLNDVSDLAPRQSKGRGKGKAKGKREKRSDRPTRPA